MLIVGLTVLKLHMTYPPERERKLCSVRHSWISLSPTSWLGCAVKRMSKQWDYHVDFLHSIFGSFSALHQLF
uniref:Uncharacterized protein n=1 Tax=Rhizophora mucronata TaxID=61149 RepID=A0A2P2KI70_RHIMU